MIEAGDAPAGSRDKEATIWFAVVQKTADVPIERGENKGKTLTYTNIVREMLPVGTWNGKAISQPRSVRRARAVMRPETEGLIVLCRKRKAGPIIGCRAARSRLEPRLVSRLAPLGYRESAMSACRHQPALLQQAVDLRRAAAEGDVGLRADRAGCRRE